MPHSDTNSGRLNRCPDARAQLAEYVEGELSPLESRRLEGHLSLCGACRREEAEYRAAIGALRAPRPPAAHGDLYAGFAAKLDRTGHGLGRPRPLRWAAVSSLVLAAAIAGASASYFRGAFSPSPAPAGPVVAMAVRPGPAPTQQKAPERKTVVKTEPEVKFEWKSDAPPSDAKTDAADAVNAIPDPFDAKRVAQTSPREETARETAHETKRSRRPQVAANERQDFLGVKPVHGPSAEEIIVQKRREVTVAQYGAPQPVDDMAHVVNDHTQPIRPFIVATDPESKSAAQPAPAGAPVTIASSDETEVMVNGKPADVQTAVGYDKRGRPVLVKMNIAVKPEREKPHPEK